MTNKDHNNRPARDEEQEQAKNDNKAAEKRLDSALTELRRELEAEKARHLRTRADLENIRRRAAKETAAAGLAAKKEILGELLSFLDHFARAREQVQDPAAAEGLAIMARQFESFLERQGVRPLECLGQPFDPEEQEGLGYVETGDCLPGCVAEEVCRGYKLGDELLKPARVIVARETDA